MRLAISNLAWQLLGDGAAFEGMLEHIRHVADIGAVLGARVLVFGSPGNRLRLEMEPERAWARARERLRILGEITLSSGVIIGVEPVPAAYGGDFLDSWPDVLRIVREVDHPGLRVHLDTACVALGFGSIETAIAETSELLTHFHAAQPQLGDFSEPLPSHGLAAAALHLAGYDHWVAIEMREQPEDPVAAVAQAVQAVRRIYRL
jgi:sugar phosphate isomerase/epimerase